MAYTILGHIYPIPLQPWQARGSKSDTVLSQAVQQSGRVTLKGRETTCVVILLDAAAQCELEREGTVCSEALVCPCVAEVVAVPVPRE